MQYVEAEINYQGRMEGRPYYYANDHSRDRMALEGHHVRIIDSRGERDAIRFGDQGFQLLDHVSAVTDFRDHDQVAAIYSPEINALVKELTSASSVLMVPRGVLRFSGRSGEAGSQDNSQVAGFVHVDSTVNAIPTLLGMTLKANGLDAPPTDRYIAFNAWRVISDPPQDYPLTVCDMRSLSEPDLVKAEAIFDLKGAPEWSFESYLVQYNPAHRWHYFSNMTRDEVLVFKSFDSEQQPLQCVPHVAFADPTCPADAPPRASIEVRGYAFFE